MKVLACGSRDYNDRNMLFYVLDYFNSQCAITQIIHGAASGADSLAGEWANIRGKPFTDYPANWKNLDVDGVVIRQGKYGPYNVVAGFQRNQKMLDEGKPNLVVAFPGGSGTDDMVTRSRKANVLTHQLLLSGIWI